MTHVRCSALQALQELQWHSELPLVAFSSVRKKYLIFPLLRLVVGYSINTPIDIGASRSCGQGIFLDVR